MSEDEPQLAAHPRLFTLPDETYLDRRTAADVLTEAGFQRRPATLAKLATVGGGPPYQLFGRKPLYRVDGLRDWALSGLSAPKTSTADTGVEAT